MSRLLLLLILLTSVVRAQSLEQIESKYSNSESPDFSLAKSYLEKVIGDSLTQKVELASSIYYWGLNDNDVEGNAEALKKELDYLAPILDERTSKRFYELYENNNPILFDELKTFWINRDFSPGTVFNERLIEHVERINQAKKTYTRNSRNVYGTDDRGLVYVKYGQADVVHEGTLTFGLNEVDQFCVTYDRCLTNIMFDFLFEIDPNPEYEIWIYRDLLNSQKRNAVFIFAKTVGQEFKRYRTIDDMIPARAQFKEIGTVTGGMALSWIYYRKLMGRDPYFAETYAFYNDKYYSDSGGLGAQQGQILKNETSWKTQQMINDTPIQESTIARRVFNVPLEYYVYRRFDERGRSNYAVFVESRRTEDFNQKFSFSEGIESMFGRDGDYELYQGVRLLDEHSDELGQVREVVPHSVDDEEEVMMGQSVFMLASSPVIASVQIFNELWKQRVNEIQASIIGLNQTIIDVPKPLLEDRTTLTMSDIIIGFGLDYDLLDERPFPFYVENEKQIPAGEIIAINVGVANISGTDPSVRIEYSIRPKRRGLNRLFKNEYNTRINFQIPTDSSILVENLEIETEPLEQGDYVLSIKFTDVNTNDSVEQKVDFSVVESLSTVNQ